MALQKLERFAKRHGVTLSINYIQNFIYISYFKVDDKTKRRQGIGSLVMREVIAEATRQKKDIRLFVETIGDGTIKAATAFYRKHGFKTYVKSRRRMRWKYYEQSTKRKKEAPDQQRICCALLSGEGSETHHYESGAAVQKASTDNHLQGIQASP